MEWERNGFAVNFPLHRFQNERKSQFQSSQRPIETLIHLAKVKLEKKNNNNNEKLGNAQKALIEPSQIRIKILATNPTNLAGEPHDNNKKKETIKTSQLGNSKELNEATIAIQIETQYNKKKPNKIKQQQQPTRPTKNKSKANAK